MLCRHLPLRDPASRRQCYREMSISFCDPIRCINRLLSLWNVNSSFPSTTSTFQVVAFVSILGAVYVEVFLKEGIRDSDGLTQPILEGGSGINHNDGDNSQKPAPGFKKIPSMGGHYLLGEE